MHHLSCKQHMCQTIMGLSWFVTCTNHCCAAAGGVLYNNILSDHDQYDMTKFEHDVSVALPESRVLHLRGL